MKKTFWTTTEYTSQIDCENNPIAIEGGRFALFANKGQAEYDTKWLRDKFPDKAKACGGPKIVKITFKVCK